MDLLVELDGVRPGSRQCKAQCRAASSPFFLAVSVPRALPARAAGQTPLARQLSRALTVPHVAKSRSAAVVIDLTTGKPVFAHNLSLPLIPASNQKLAVTYACLLALGPSFRFGTDVLGEGELDGALWRGDIVLKGYGDPTLSTLDLLKLASQLHAQGIRRIGGRIVGDESFFDSKRVGPGWKPWFFINESAPLSALTVDRARYRGHTTRDPALAAALTFRAALLRVGISVAGRAMTGQADPEAVPLASIESVPLVEILRYMGHESDNFTAEILLKQLGAGYADQGTSAAGATVIRQLLVEQQIPVAGVRIVDGSGLSRYDRLTANAVVSMLRASWLDEDTREILLYLPARGRPERNAGQADAGHGRSRTGQGQDGHPERGLGALGLRESPLCVLGDPERLARLDVLGAQGPGPLRRGPSREVATSAPARRGSGRRPAAPSAASSRDPRRRSRRPSSSRPSFRPWRPSPRALWPPRPA